VDAVKGCLFAAAAVKGFSVAAPPTTFFFLRAALGAAILDLGCLPVSSPLCCTLGCLSVVVSLLVLAASLELLLLVAMAVVRREMDCFSSGGLLSPFLVEGLGMDFDFMSRELGACSFELAPEACME
jgi:hypothetical protein